MTPPCPTQRVDGIGARGDSGCGHERCPAPRHRGWAMFVRQAPSDVPETRRCGSPIGDVASGEIGDVLPIAAADDEGGKAKRVVARTAPRT